jgi:hypothetical protein
MTMTFPVGLLGLNKVATTGPLSPCLPWCTEANSKDSMPGYAFGYSDITSYMGPFVI